MAQAMGLKKDADVAQAVHDMTTRLGLPTGLTELGVTEALFDKIIHHALLEHCHKTNPRIASAEDYRLTLKSSKSASIAIRKNLIITFFFFKLSRH